MNFINQHRLVSFMILILILAVFTQSAMAISIRSKRYKPHPWSVQVMLDAEVDNDELNGIRFALSRNYSRYSSMRVSLGFLGREIDNHGNRWFCSNDFYCEFDDEADFDFKGADLAIQYLSHPAPNGRFDFYWGIGPRLSVQEADPDATYFLYSDYPYSWYEEVDPNDVTKVGFGLEAVLGLEWFLGRSFSLLAEYGIAAQNEWYVFEREYYDCCGNHSTELESYDNGGHFDTARMRLGLAFHF